MDEKAWQDNYHEKDQHQIRHMAKLHDELNTANRRIEDLRDDLIEISALFPNPDLDAIERIVKHALLEV